MELKFRGEGQKVLGAGDWWVEHEHARTTLCTGLWEGGKVIALLVAEGEDAYSDYLKGKGDSIIKATNSHDQLVSALTACLKRLVADCADKSCVEIMEARAALTAAGVA